MLILRRLLIAGIAVLLVWRIGASGLAGHYAERLAQGDNTAAAPALTWDSRQPEALYVQAVEVSASDPEAALALLLRAYRQNPAETRPLIAAARILLERGDEARADALVNAATALRPADPRIQRHATGYWLARGDLAKALPHASFALETNPDSRAQLFPFLLEVADEPATRLALRPFTQSPPVWWEEFFAEVARRALDVEAVRVLYALRSQASRAPVTEAERKSYVARLIQDGRIAEAYIAWLNGLDRSERGQLGLVHNGGFELEPRNWGFDWQLRSSPTALIDRRRTHGSDGSLALNLRFERHEARFANLHQMLFLDPARYRLSGRVRTDSLETKGGLKWVVRCLQPEVAELGESERFLGTNEWRDFSIAFEVTEPCTLQEIRLVSAGSRRFEHEMTGSAWFDRIAIRRVPTTASQ